MRPLHRHLGLLLLISYVSIGASYAFLLPPFHVPDERRHWIAAHHHMAKLVTGSGTVCSTDVSLDFHFQLGLKFKPHVKMPSGTFSRVAELRPECEERPRYGRSNVTTYPGVVLSRLFIPREPASGVESLAGFYLSRLLHGALIGLMLLRLWWLARNESTGPPGLLALLLMSLSPLFIQQSFGVTNDVVTNAFALAVCTWLVFSDRLGRLDEVVLVVLGGIAAFTKPVLAVPLLPVTALGLCLHGLRQAPGEPWLRSMREALARKRVLVGALVAVAVSGFIYARSHLRIGWGGPGEQFEFMTGHPWFAFKVIALKIVEIFSSPSVFLDNLGYMETRIGSATLASFGLLVALTAGVEMVGLVQGGRRLANDAALRTQFVRALWPVAVFASLAIGSLAFGIFMIGMRAYLVGPLGSDVLFSMQPRYLFPDLLVGVGVVTAIARTFLSSESSSVDSMVDTSGRGGRIARIVVVGVFGVTLISFAGNLATDILSRYF